MQIGADETLPSPRRRDRCEYGAVAAADFKITLRARKETVGESDNQLIASHEPEMRFLDLDERIESDRIETADGVGELRREHRNPRALRHATAACRAIPIAWPDWCGPQNGVTCAAGE